MRCGLTIETFISFHTNTFFRNIRKDNLYQVLYWKYHFAFNCGVLGMEIH